MNKEALRQYLIGNPDIVEEFLSNAGFHSVKYYEGSEQWRMNLDEDSNSQAIRLSSKDLSYKDYKFGEKGDIFSLIMLKKGINFHLALQYVASKTKFVDIDCEEDKCTFPYGGFYKSIKKDDIDLDLEEYDEILLDVYPKTISKLFLCDNISVDTQEKFEIRYCHDSHRVVIPCYDEGKLIGAIGRYNQKIVPNDIPKYLPILKYNKSQFLFGMNENKEHIKNNIVIGS